MDNDSAYFMKIAYELAVENELRDEVPVGAVVSLDNNIIGKGSNSSLTKSDPSAHAEIVALRKAGKVIGNYRLNGAILYVTLEPCTMCYSAAVHARIDKIFFGTSDPKSGIFSTGAFEKIKDIFNHGIEIESGIMAKESSKLLKNFFKDRRGRD